MEATSATSTELTSEGVSDIIGKANPVVVMLIGLPGSGKSTFCNEVMGCSSRPWVRICQDSINNGKAGTKIQCLSSAASALESGKSVFIDRCNIDREQRMDFLKLGSNIVEKHAVILDLPAKLCVSRSVSRIGHEGNLEGGKAAAVVNQMVSKKELPELAEGFTRITYCQNESDVNQTIKTYCLFGPFDSLSSGYFGKKKRDSTQLGIKQFFKRVNFSVNAGSDPFASQKHIPNDIDIKETSGILVPKMNHDSSNKVLENLKEQNKLDASSSSSTISSCQVCTLAFPSISTADFQFDVEKASDIIVEKVEEYINRIGDSTLVLVDLSHRSKILSLVKSKAAKKNINPEKFYTVVGDITRLFSGTGLCCNVIANAANWRLKPGGGGVNAAIFQAAGSDLEIATKEKATYLSPGNAVVVPLPSTSPLFSREGVSHVIHVLGPNMNPMRPDCLKDDYVEGCKVLREAYSSLFEGFLTILQSQEVNSMKNSGLSSGSEALQKLDHGIDHQKGKREAACESDKNKMYKGVQHDSKSDPNHSLEVNGSQHHRVSGSKSNSWSSWALSLYNIAMHPETCKNTLLEVSDAVIVMDDAYPKARHHLLVLARIDGIDSISDIRGDDISLLRNMHNTGLKWAEHFLKADDSLLFRLGYHSEPSMRQLHLHVISQDFDSDHLKNKKHWNSFTTPFFLDSVDVLKEVEENGQVILKNVDKFKSMELRCHRCKSAHPNMPRLKSHIRSCKASFPVFLLQNHRLVSSESNINFFDL